MWLFWLLLAHQGLLLALSCASQASPTSRTNFIIFMADDLGYGEINHNGTWGFPTNPLAADGLKPVIRKPGFGVIETPNLARMASQGIRALMSYSPSSICAPSRASIFSERHVGVVDCIRGNWFADRNELKPGLGDNFVQAIQKKAGHATGYFGKWGLGVVQGAPWNHGFDSYVGQLYHTEAHIYFPDFYYELHKSATSKLPQSVADIEAFKVQIVENMGHRWNDTNCPLDAESDCVHINDVVMDHAMRFIEQNVAAARPFLAFIAPTYPHAGNYNEGDRASVRIAPVKRITPQRLTQTPYIMRGHASQIEQHLDRDVGRILDYLDARPKLDANTFFIFTSDNGASEEVPFQNIRKVFNPTNSLRGSKRNLYEGGIRVPTILRWPGTFPAGTVSLLPFALYDLGPTLREIVGAAPAPERTAVLDKPTLVASMFKAWRDGDENSVLVKRQFLQFEMCRKPGEDVQCTAAIIDLRKWAEGRGQLFKLIQRPGKNRRTELYDLRQSPKELSKTISPARALELRMVKDANRIFFKSNCEFAPTQRPSSSNSDKKRK